LAATTHSGAEVCNRYKNKLFMKYKKRSTGKSSLYNYVKKGKQVGQYLAVFNPPNRSFGYSIPGQVFLGQSPFQSGRFYEQTNIFSSYDFL